MSQPDFHDELEALADKHGLVDFAFCGVTLEGSDKSLTRVGGPTPDLANRQRYLYLGGLMLEGVLDLYQDRYKLRTNKEDEP